MKKPTDPAIKKIITDLVEFEYDHGAKAVAIVVIAADGNARINYCATSGSHADLYINAHVLTDSLLKKSIEARK